MYKQLKEYMKEKKYTIAQMSHITGIPMATIHHGMVNEREPYGINAIKARKFLDSIQKVELPHKKEVKPQLREVERCDLHSVDEIVSALNAGEVVIDGENGRKIKKVDDVVVVYSAAMNPMFINSALDCDRSYYCLREKKIKLVVGGRYKAFNGKEVYIFAEEKNKLDARIEFRGTVLGELSVKFFSADGIVCGEDKSYNIREEA